MTSREKSILFAVAGCHALIHAYMLVFPTIYRALGSSLDLEFSGVGFVGMASYMAFGFGALPAGFLSDRLGARMMLVLCIAGTALASVLAFLAASPVGVVLALVLLGLSASLYHPAGLSLLSTSIKHGLGKALGIHGMAGTVGVALAPVVAGSITARYGWPYAYLALGAVGGGLLAVLLAGLGFHRGEPAPAGGHKPPPRLVASLNRHLLVIYLVSAVYGLIYRGVMTFFPTYLSQRVSFIGDDVGRLGLVSSGILAVSIIGPLVGGYLASGRRVIERNLLLVFLMLACLSVGFYFTDGIRLVMVAGPTVLLIFGFQPLLNTLIAKSSDAARRGSIYGINFTVSFGIGAFASGIGGVFGERFGLRSIFLLMLGLCIIEIILITIAKSMRRTENGLSESPGESG
jgi:MFS family permease